jgi:hypothetical protein
MAASRPSELAGNQKSACERNRSPSVSRGARRKPLWRGRRDDYPINSVVSAKPRRNMPGSDDQSREVASATSDPLDLARRWKWPALSVVMRQATLYSECQDACISGA